MTWNRMVVALVLAVAAGCGGGGDNEPEVGSVAENETAEPAEEAAPVETEPAEPAQADQPPEESAESAPTTTTTTTTVAPILPLIEVEPAAAGSRPRLAWPDVAGAARYTLVILGSDGTPYWAWSGTDTSTPVGGIDDPDVAGPWVHEPMTWTVAALDADGVPIALSNASPLSP